MLNSYLKRKLVRTVVFLTMGFLASLLSVAVAASDPSLYQAQLPIINAENEPSADELKVALAQVLSKLTHQQDIADSPTWADSLNHAKDYMLSYQYTPGDSAQQLLLQVDFDPAAITRLLNSKGHNVASAVGPTLQQRWLVWLAIDNGNEQHLMGSGSRSTYSKTIDAAAAQLGVSIEWPLLDLTDLNTLTFSQVWDANWSVIDAASKRYPHDGTVLIHLSKGAGVVPLWTSAWTLKTTQQSLEGNFSANEALDALRGSMAQLSAVVADSKTSTPVQPAKPLTVSQVQLIVYGIGDLAAMDGLKNNLQQLAVVRNVEVAELSPDEVTFTIQSQGGAEGLREAIANQLTTLVKTTSADGNTHSDALTYQWTL